jgi:hypothetical protein
MKRLPEDDQIDAGNGIICVDGEPKLRGPRLPEYDQIARASGFSDPDDSMMTDKERQQHAFVDAVSRALSGETPVTEGEDKGWLFIGGVNFSQPLYVKDGSGMPLFRVTVEAMPNLPAEYLSRVLPALLKRSPDGSVLRLTLRFDDDSLAYSNQPSEEQIAWWMRYMASIKRKPDPNK